MELFKTCDSTYFESRELLNVKSETCDFTVFERIEYGEPTRYLLDFKEGTITQINCAMGYNLSYGLCERIYDELCYHPSIELCYDYELDNLMNDLAYDFYNSDFIEKRKAWAKLTCVLDAINNEIDKSILGTEYDKYDGDIIKMFVAALKNASVYECVMDYYGLDYEQDEDFNYRVAFRNNEIYAHMNSINKALSRFGESKDIQDLKKSIEYIMDELDYRLQEE